MAEEELVASEAKTVKGFRINQPDPRILHAGLGVVVAAAQTGGGGILKVAEVDDPGGSPGTNGNLALLSVIEEQDLPHALGNYRGIGA